MEVAGRIASLGRRGPPSESRGGDSQTGKDIGARARPSRTADGRSRWGRPEQGEGRLRRRPSPNPYSGAAPERRSKGGSQPVPDRRSSALAAMVALSRPAKGSAASGETPSATASAIRALVTRPK